MRRYNTITTSAETYRIAVYIFIDPVLHDDKITIINIPVSENSDEVIYNDVMNIEEFLEEHNIRYSQSY